MKMVEFKPELAKKRMEELKVLTAKERNEELQALLVDRINNTMQIALIVGAMQEAGDPIIEELFPSTILSLFEDVRTGRLLPQAFDHFSGNTQLTQSIARLPVTVQRGLLEGEHVPLVIWKEGKTELLKTDPRNLLPAQRRQVFDGNYIRNQSQQVAWMAEQERKQRVKTKDKAEPDIEVHARSGEIVVNKAGIRISAKMLAKYLEQLS